MTGAVRKDIRARAAAALGTVTGWNVISAWTQDVDITALPACAVATPQAQQDRVDHDDTQSHSITLAVILKRAGEPDDIEDELDDDADAFAPLIEAAIRNDSRDCQLTNTAVRIDRAGARPVGTLTLQFTVTTWT